MIPREQLDNILSKIDLVDLVGEYVPLKKAGSNFRGLCPFHQEKSPSFMVSAPKQIYHCFGCGEGGNAFGFLMKVENLPFPEAAQKLADKAGVVLQHSQKEKVEKDQREILYKVNRYAAWFFTENLKNQNGKKAASYLEKRLIKPETITEFQIGFSPDSWDGLTRFLLSKKVPLELAEKVGLIRKRKDGSYYDFFRNRILFPLIDTENRIIGFGGRRLDDSKTEEAKYINSPESPIYHKGNSIYGLYQAKKSIREKNEAILVEGYLDLISLSQNGIKNVVAPLGTALTLPQIKTLQRLTEHLILLFDGDAAGKKAALRAIPIIFQAGLHPRVLFLPDQEDPDSFIRKKGPQKLEELLTKSPLAMEWILVDNLTHIGTRVSDKVEAARKILPYIEALSSPLEQKSYQAKLANFLGIHVKDLEPKSGYKHAEHSRTPTRLEGKISLERILLGFYVKDPLALDPLVSQEIFEQFEDEELRSLGLQFVQQMKEHGKLRIDDLLTDSNANQTASLITEIVMGSETWDKEEIAQKTLKDCLEKLKKKQLQNRLKKITEEIKLAELKSDHEALNTLLTHKSEVTKSLKEF